MKINFCYYLCVPILLCTSVNAFHSNKTVEGYPVSFLLDECPGSMKPTIISRRNLRFIEIFVSGAGVPLGTRDKFYTYFSVDAMARDPTIDWSKRTVFYIPGWMDNHAGFAMGRVVKILYKRLGYNVWALNILKFMTEEFPVASRAMMAVGKHVGEMLARIKAIQPKFDPKKLDLLGLSLGGQTMSFIAKSFYKLTGVKVARLTGMDPAGPCFRNRGPEGRVDDSDADFVDLVLTNIDTYGMAPPVGHVNYYVNGGEFQPGEVYWMMCGPFCSHGRAFTLWAAALAFPEAFIAIKCDSVQQARDRQCYDRKPMETIQFGPFVDRNKTGIYYLATTSTFPYFMGKNGLKMENDYVVKQLTRMNSQDVLQL